MLPSLMRVLLNSLRLFSMFFHLPHSYVKKETEQEQNIIDLMYVTVMINNRKEGTVVILGIFSYILMVRMNNAN